MGRFSSWAQAQGQLEKATELPKVVEVSHYEPQDYVVENHELRSESNGIRYRVSPNMADKHPKVAIFGSKVRGIPLDGWVKVGRRYLPTHIGNACVLRPVNQESAVIKLNEEEADRQLGQMLFGKEGYGYGGDEVPTASPTAVSPARGRQLIRPETPAPGAEPLLPVGFGACYEVVFDRVAIRSAPSLTATTVEVKKRGETVELFGWDASRAWRRCPADATGTTAGWVMLDHADFGPLVRPKGAKLSALPLEPLCCAAEEDQLPELRRFLSEGQNPCACDASGASALELAVRSDARDCAVYLIEAGAVTSPDQSQVALESAASSGTRSLVEALLGHTVSDNEALQAALAELTADARIAADRILELLETDAEANQKAKENEERLKEENEKEEREREEPALSQAEPTGETTEPRIPPAEQPKEWKHRRKGGELHEVVHKAVAIRYMPSTTADMVGTRICGQFVELFESSADKKWRKMEDPETGEEGWMLLHHGQIGALVRPVTEDRLE